MKKQAWIILLIVVISVLLSNIAGCKAPQTELPVETDNTAASDGEVTEEQREFIIKGLRLYYMFNCPQGFIDHDYPKIPGEQGEGWYAVLPDFGYTSVAQLQEDFDRCILLDWSLNRDWQYMEENGVIYGFDPAKGHEVVLFDEPFEFRLISSTEGKYEVEVTYSSYGEGGCGRSTVLITVENNKIIDIAYF